MPDPLLYLQAFVVVAGVSAAIVFALRFVAPKTPHARCFACVAGLTAGHAAGFALLKFRLSWPPANAQDRYVAILLPAVILLELVASWERVPPRAARGLRIFLAVVAGRVLLHRSVYLSEGQIAQSLITLVLLAALIGGLWTLLLQLAQRSPGLAIPWTLAATIQSAGVAIMLAGYVKGGIAALIATAAMLGASIACARGSRMPLPALIGFGVVSLTTLLLIGTHFGRLPTVSALILLITPLLLWTAEIPWLKQRSARLAAALRFALVAAALAAVVLAAKRAFDRDLAPLLGSVEVLGQESTTGERRVPLARWCSLSVAPILLSDTTLSQKLRREAIIEGIDPETPATT